MATHTDIRKWAKERGLKVGDKGPVSPDVVAQYQAAHTDPDYPGAEDGADPGAEPGGQVVTAAPPPPADTRQAERTPSAPPKPRAAGRGFLGWLRGDRAAAGKKPARKLARMSIANLIEDAWGQMAWAASPLPPMQRLLQAQAPFAGIALEDALAGTVVDRALQPVARAEDKAKAVGGLLCPPMALMLVLATAPQPQAVADPSTNEQTYVWPELTLQHKSALMTLRWSLMLWSEAGHMRLDQYKERAEAAAERGRQADEFMAYILGMIPPADEPGDQDGPAADSVQTAVNAEDEAIRRAQQLFGDSP